MQQTNDIRWQQRFQNFSKSFHYLGKSLLIENPSDTERAGIIQFYEISFELAWKTLKDFLNDEGFTVKSPRDAIKTAYQAEYITNGHLWLEALDDRNLTAHTYDDKTASEVLGKIKNEYFGLLQDFHIWGATKIQS